MNIPQRMIEKINEYFELIGEDVSIGSGNKVSLFKYGDKKFAVEIYEWMD